MRFSFLLFVLLISNAVAQLTPRQAILGKVLDSSGNPVSHVDVCSQWGPLYGKPWEPLGLIIKGKIGATTNEKGEFSLPFVGPAMNSGGYVAILAYDQDRTHGALVEMPFTDIQKPVILKLQSVHAVRYRLRVPEPVDARSIVGSLVTDEGTHVGPVFGTTGILFLPPGRYGLRIGGFRDANVFSESFEVSDRDITLRTLHFQLSPIARHYGKGTPQFTTLEDMEHKPFDIGTVQGHWTLLYFWETGCGPCVAEGMPSLMAFVKSHGESQEKFRIIAIAARQPEDGEDWNAYRRKTLNFENNVWHGVPSFPLAYDETMRMTADWGIHMFPTYVLIDPKGNIVRGGDMKMLAAKLDGGKSSERVGTN